MEPTPVVNLRYGIAGSSKDCRMAATTMVHVTVDESLKNQATETRASMGLTVSDAARIPCWRRLLIDSSPEWHQRWRASHLCSRWYAFGSV